MQCEVTDQACYPESPGGWGTEWLTRTLEEGSRAALLVLTTSTNGSKTLLSELQNPFVL